MSNEKPDEDWVLVDLVENIITDAQDEPHLTSAEHALMGAGEIRREWLPEHDIRVRAEATEAKVRADALREAAWRLEEMESAHNVAECAAYVEGEVGRQECIDRWIAACEEPHTWLLERADEFEREARA